MDQWSMIPEISDLDSRVTLYNQIPTFKSMPWKYGTFKLKIEEVGDIEYTSSNFPADLDFDRDSGLECFVFEPATAQKTENALKGWYLGEGYHKSLIPIPILGVF